MSVRLPRSQGAQDTLSATAPLDVFLATPMQRIQLLKDGLRARDAKTILRSLDLQLSRACEALNVSRAKLDAKARRDEPLSVLEGERVLGVAKLIGQVQRMVQQSGDPEGFSASAWISAWLDEPLPALRGDRPIKLLDTMEGQALVATLLSQMQSGAYA